MQNSKFKIQNLFLIFSILYFAFSIGCSVPNLEAPECAASRSSLKEFYSYHFGGEMRFSPENLKLHEKFLTPEFANSLQNLQTENDIFTTNNIDFPKAFRIGGCEAISSEKTNVEVLFFWKDDARSEQKSIKVEAIKQDGKWLINEIVN